MESPHVKKLAAPVYPPSLHAVIPCVVVHRRCRDCHIGQSQGLVFQQRH
jgi:hypothetical protein